jgi:hypothetical protein
LELLVHDDAWRSRVVVVVDFVFVILVVEADDTIPVE